MRGTASPFLRDLLEVDFDERGDLVTRFGAPRQSTLILYRGEERLWFSVAETRRDVMSSAAMSGRSGPVWLAGGMSISFAVAGTFPTFLLVQAELDPELFRYVAAVLLIGAAASLLVPVLNDLASRALSKGVARRGLLRRSRASRTSRTVPRSSTGSKGFRRKTEPGIASGPGSGSSSV